MSLSSNDMDRYQELAAEAGRKLDALTQITMTATLQLQSMSKKMPSNASAVTSKVIQYRFFRCAKE